MAFPQEPQFEDIDKVLFLNRTTGEDVTLQPRVGEDYPEGMYMMTSVDANDNATRHPFVVVDMDLTEGETSFKATIYERSRDFAVKHKKAFAFTAVTTVSGVATAVAVLRHSRHNS